MNPKYHLLVAVAALSLSACSTDDTNTGPEIGEYKISFTVAENPESRTTLDASDFLRWVSTDEVGVYTVGKNLNSNTLTTADVSKSPVEFVGTLKQMVSSGDQFYAYYPYDAAQSTDPKAVKLSIPAEQSQTKAGVYNGESHPLVAVPMEFQWEQGSDACHLSSVRFRQLGAIVELQLFSSGEALRSEKIRSVTFESDTPIAGDFSFDLTGVTKDEEEKLTISEDESKEVTTSLGESAVIPATKDEAARIYLTIAPGTYTGQIVVETDAAQYTFRLTKALTFERAAIMGLPADLAEAERDAINPDASIHFADAEVKRICVENWDTNGDGELSYKEAAAVTSIGSKFDSNDSISSFNELQYFTGLQSIEDYAFYGCSSLTSITIPEGVTEIGGDAFTRCSSLTSITIPEGVTTIGDYAFYNCSSLTSINIPQTVSSIGEVPFSGCSSLSSFEGKYASADHRCLIQDGTLLAFASADLTEYTIPAGVTSIGDHAFSSCSSLTSINIPAGVTSIGDYAFSHCSSLTSINIPEGVIEIGASAFRNCGSLTSIHIPNGVTTIGKGVFSNCSSLTSITIPNGVTSIGDSAFAGCSNLTSINIPEGVTTIEWYAFSSCSSLTSINIPDGVTEIGDRAFWGCSSLTSVYCKPTNPPTLGSSPFYNTPSSMKIYVPTASVEAYKAATNWSSYASQIVADDNQSGPNENDLIQFEDQNVKTICVTNWDTNGDGELSYKEAAAVTSIESKFKGTSISSFNELQYFTGLQWIGYSAFNGCSSLTSINLPDGVTEIGHSAFYSCSSLTSINIPQTISSIGPYAFAGCSSLSSFEGKYASADHRCLIRDGVLLMFAPAGLTEYTIPDGVTAIGEPAFYGCSSLTSINIPDRVTAIEEYAFQNCSSLTSINIPNGVTAIENSAFDGCSSLTNINLPDGVTAIRDSAFRDCSSLTSINIPDGVTAIGDYAFYGCSSLTSIHLPDGVTAIGDSAFRDCSSLTSINIPDGVTTIGHAAFYECSSLTSIHIPDGVTKIGEWAFSSCSSLTSIVIPEGVTAIGEYAFYCSRLTSVYCKPTTPPTIGGNAFSYTPSSMKIYVTAASVEAYKTAAGWSEYADRIIADNN